ncbi:MAG: HAMP domain-containing protein [Chloroflexi bacterium]|nr:HAMP domain-containing protein [Chloroflexota bacterium]
MMDRLFSLRVRVLVLVLLAVVPAMLLMLLSARDRRDASEESGRARALQLARSVEVDYMHRIDTTRSFLAPLAQVFALVPNLSNVTQTACASFFDKLIANTADIFQVGVASTDGTVICRSPAGAESAASVAAEPFFTTAMNSRAFSVGHFEFESVTQKPALHVGYPIIGPAGTVTGVLYAALDLNAISTDLGKTADPSVSFITLITPTGTILARYPNPEQWVGKEVGTPPSLAAMESGGPGITRESVSLDGISVVSATVGLANAGASEPGAGSISALVSVGIPKDQVFAGINDRLRDDLLGLLAAALLAGGLGWFGSGVLLRKLQLYVGTTRRFSEGDLAARAGPPYPRNELGALGRSIDDMAVAVSERQQEIQRLNEGLEQRVADRTAQLEAANKELESFSYSVSHDLRAPLRSIDGFSQALVEDYADVLDDEGKQMLGRVRAGSQRMGQLIDDILQLSRVSRAEVGKEEVDLSVMASGIVDDLRRTEPHREVEFQAAPGLTVTGDRRLLRIALENLIGNAWKFTSHTERPQIEFGAEGGPGKPVYFVRDNGAGFDMAYAGKLFGAFQRLHAMDEFPGTGVGLATVQRVIHRHGGRVWAEGATGQGATFSFTLGGSS